MKRAYPTTPVWVKLTAAAALTLAIGWWSLDWRDRRANERAMARAQYEGSYQEMPEQYRSAACADGGQLDLHPDDGRFP